MDHLIKLGGIQLLLQITAHAYDWNYSGRAETVKAALDVLVRNAVPTSLSHLITIITITS
jgi:hypothetical protein